jgi:chemotaxis protein methyltransferase CheR
MMAAISLAASLPQVNTGRDNELQLTPAEYQRFRDFVLERIGLDFSEDKRHMLGRGLAEAMRATSCTNLDEFYALLRRSSVTSLVWDQLVSALTVGETYFLRNTSHFDALSKFILPEIMTQREHSSRRIRIWSAGCSTGEEPYSIAILLSEVIPNPDSWNITILATDINRDALRKAREGLYGPWSFRGVDKRIQDTYFRLDGRQYAIADRIKRMVTFEYLNLVGDYYPSLTNNTNAMDVIFCRNVTIYFSPQVTLEVVKRFHNCLTDGGWLIPGPSEPNMIFYGDFEFKNFPGTVVYRKAPPVPAAAQPASAFLPQTPPFVSAPLIMKSRPPAAPPRPVELPKTATPPDPYQVALDLLQEGKVDEALVKLYEKLDRNADFVTAYYTLGKIYANKGNLEEAQHWCERAIKKDKLHPEPYYTLSLVYEQHGLIDMAMDALKKTIYLDRNFVLAHYNLAQIYQRQGDMVSARKSLQNAQRLLEGKPRDELVPEGDGLMVGRLLELIDNQLAVMKPA